jgi:hypothetical protein
VKSKIIKLIEADSRKVEIDSGDWKNEMMVKGHKVSVTQEQ